MRKSLTFTLSLLLSLLFTLIARAHGAPLAPPTASTEQVFGTDDRIAVAPTGANVEARFRGLLDAFGDIGPMGCTATHLGKGLVVTAGHCFKAGPLKQTDVACGDVTVGWGNRSARGPRLVSKCLKILAMIVDDIQGLDYAFLQVDAYPSVSIALETKVPAHVDDPVTLFSHPFNGILLWSPPCLLQPTTSNVILEAYLFHRCDTVGGSSGAALLSAKTGRIVGVHDGAFGSDASGANFATRIERTPALALLKRVVAAGPPTRLPPAR